MKRSTRMKRKALWISIIGILLIAIVSQYSYRHYITQKQIQLKNKQSLLINYKLKHLFHGAHRFG